MNYGLQQVMSSGTGRAAYNSLSPALKLAVNQVRLTIHVTHGLPAIQVIMLQ